MKDHLQIGFYQYVCYIFLHQSIFSLSPYIVSSLLMPYNFSLVNTLWRITQRASRRRTFFDLSSTACHIINAITSQLDSIIQSNTAVVKLRVWLSTEETVVDRDWMIEATSQLAIAVNIHVIHVKHSRQKCQASGCFLHIMFRNINVSLIYGICS